MAWLLDTNILSERRKPKPEPRVTAFYDAQPLNALYISVVSIAEIRFGATGAILTRHACQFSTRGNEPSVFLAATTSEFF